VAANRTCDVDGKPPERIWPTIIIYGTVRFAEAKRLAFALNCEARLVPQSAALDAFPNYERRPRLRGLLGVVANETVPTVEVGIEQQMALTALLAYGPYEKVEPAVDFGGAWDNFFVPLVRLSGEQKIESFTTARTTNSAHQR
jgi:hypothetical protein